jgi:hypothetical protein
MSPYQCVPLRYHERMTGSIGHEPSTVEEIPSVTVRCWRCHDRGRRAPTLAIVRLADDGWGGPGPAVRAAVGRLGQMALKREIGAPPRIVWDWPPRIGDAVQLVCRQCGHKPRPRLGGLYREAEQALAEDQREIYR